MCVKKFLRNMQCVVKKAADDQGVFTINWDSNRISEFVIESLAIVILFILKLAIKF